MKYTLKKIAAVILAVLLAFMLFPQTAIAAGSAGVSLSKSSVTVGNSFSATLSFSGGGSYVAGVQAYITYDSSMIQYVSASGDGDATVSGGNGSIVLETTSTSKSSLSIKLTFKALAVGSASISITSSDVVDWDGNTVGNATASKSVTIKTPASPSPSPSSAPSPSKTQTQEPVDTETPPKTTEIEQAIKTDIEGTTYYLWRDLSNVTLPEGFVTASYTYKSETIQVATSQKMGLTLLYMTDSEGLNGKFYLYDEKADTFIKYITMSFVADEYTILKPDTSVNIPDGYKETTHVINEEKINAWETQEGATFFLIYAKNKDGIAGFYSYDTYEGTLQRFNETPVTVEKEPLETSSAVNVNANEINSRGVFERLLDDEQVLAITAVLAGIIIILTAIIVSMLLSQKKKAMLSALQPYSSEESDAEEFDMDRKEDSEQQTPDNAPDEKEEHTESIERKEDDGIDTKDTNNF